MKILVLEDRGSVAQYMVAALEDLGHEVVHAPGIRDALSLTITSMDCLIVDLNMSPEGLTDLQRKETLGGLLTGWIWLRDNVYASAPQMKERTIVFSEYIAELKAHVLSRELRGIHIIPKQSAESPAQQVLDCIEQINKL